jgi:plastocyanin
MTRKYKSSRRRVLKTLTTAIVGGAALTGSAAAKEGDARSNHYGNGNALGAFLNEEAEWKEAPVWDSGVTDRTGRGTVDVAVGAMTPVDIPDPEAPPEGPLAFAPRAVEVSPGTTVRWTWVSNPLGFPIPHDVVSLVDDDGDPVLEPDGDPSYASPLLGYKSAPDAEEPDEEDLPTFEVTFTETGNHLYYCTPHGAPFEVHGHYNLTGMRGAVIVSDE